MNQWASCDSFLNLLTMLKSALKILELFVTFQWKLCSFLKFMSYLEKKIFFFFFRFVKTNFAKPPLHILFSLTRRGNYILYWCWSRNSFHFQPLILKIFYLKRNNLQNISGHACIRFTMLLITGCSDRSVFFSPF